MSIGFALLVGGLFAVALYLLMRDDLIDHVFGLIVISHAANLLVFGAGRLRRGAAPVLTDGSDGTDVADPLPQALVLTAIVIGFGIVAFAAVLVGRLRRARDTADRSAEELADGEAEEDAP
jgi:multicomponent Na+:H+ antiporter subunit C